MPKGGWADQLAKDGNAKAQGDLLGLRLHESRQHCGDLLLDLHVPGPRLELEESRRGFFFT